MSYSKLWEDPDFPASSASLHRDDRNSIITWLRPKDISPSPPMFVVEGTTRSDLDQGQTGDCWFIAAVACLAVSHKKLLHRIVPQNQRFDLDYTGKFRFNFWNFGRWVEVLIDDRLPTKDGGDLMYAHNRSQPNEFWAPLLEKAYAKLKGGYDSIGSGGFMRNALVDFTGGISESIGLQRLRSSPVNLFEVMNAMMQKTSMMACAITSGTDARRGLFKKHAYSITGIEQFKVSGQNVELLRLRNPYGHSEWTGEWSDGSRAWDAVPRSVKRKIELQVKNEGEFWMSFKDFLMNFDDLQLCHLEPDALAAEISCDTNQSTWTSTKLESEWIPGRSAGGKYPDTDEFWTNPQFRVNVRRETTHHVISLMQESLRYDKNFNIGFRLYKVRQSARRLSDGKKYDRSVLEELVMSPYVFSSTREVTVRTSLEPGQYVVIPCTSIPNQQTKFLLRVFTESETAAESGCAACVIL